MKKIRSIELESLTGGILPPGPGEAERCRAEGWVYYLLNGGAPPAFNVLDFTCYF